ncbi:MAG: FIG01073555: hypothetical protein [uncultured Thiotrichaceae bacterium]|uniref:DUF3179 domain-containing protein n=1 Tax=uncultured Thiotrichaceae bacterium TaxID=298394 RepID=A0A6S6U509_9GAMM|nr:MAG: FIG01073555: hypothetical protein [uncultured Thiotrichaceae bacterium]
MFSIFRQMGLKVFSVVISVLLSVGVVHAAPEKNGFDLANSTIPVSQILSGGPPRDGIPAIDQPKFIPANKADYLKPDDRVMGVKYAGEVRAYPINILNWHEIVNDTVNGQAIAVTFCPLCGSGVVYSALINGKAHKFGVSGLLYNSDVLLYDRETETLWSQILAKAISGKMVNSPLTIIPSSHTSWKAWKKQHPNTKVLSRKTGFDRDYSQSPYGNYTSDRTTYFPVAFSSKRYHPKERVLGLTLNGQQKVYPFAELAKFEGNSLRDHFAGKDLVLEFDVENRDGQIKDASGKVLPSINTFWFAWYAFHPEAEIYSYP